uniref:Uncharacterized protein n=1 Tax=Prolemur simus TaxID=1328070 RepID=A0A8C8YXV3_PROSS
QPSGKTPGRRPQRSRPVVCEVHRSPPGAAFAGSVAGVRRRRPPGLVTAVAAAGAGAWLQVPDPCDCRPRVSAILAPSLLHIYDRPSHSLASGWPLAVSKSLGRHSIPGFSL